MAVVDSDNCDVQGSLLQCEHSRRQEIDRINIPVNLSNTPIKVFLSPSLRMLLYRDGRFGVGVGVAAATVGEGAGAVAVAVVDCDGIADTEGIGVGGVEQEEISCCCCCCWSSSSSGITKVVAEARADRKAVSLGGIGDEEEDMGGWGGNLMRFENGKREAKAEEGRKEKK